MKNGNNFQGKCGAQDGECWVEIRSNTKGVGEEWNEKEEHQI